MKRINLVYDEFYADADVLLVPDWVFEQALHLPGQYSEWLLVQGRKDMVTEGFVEWLNDQIDPEEEKVRILAQHVSVSETEPRIDF